MEEYSVSASKFDGHVELDPYEVSGVRVVPSPTATSTCRARSTTSSRTISSTARRSSSGGRKKRPALLAEFLASSHVTVDQRVRQWFNALRFDVLVVIGNCRMGHDLDPARAATLTAQSVIDEILAFAESHSLPEECTEPRVKVGRYPVDLMNMLLSTHVRSETPESKRLIVETEKRMRTSRLEPMRKYAADIGGLLGSDQAIALTGRRLDGKPFDLADFRGRIVLIEAWATWCSSCIAEMPT